MKIEYVIKLRIDELCKPQYIGDGVYASFDGFQVWLKTSNGLETTNVIAIEPGVRSKLLDYFKWLDTNVAEINELKRLAEKSESLCAPD